MRAGKLVTLPGITSIASNLGATTVAEQAFVYSKDVRVTSVVLSDAEAAMATVRFANDERILVEVSCGVSIATVYNGTLREALGAGKDDEEWKKMRIVIIVCGGSNISLELLEDYKKTYGPN